MSENLDKFLDALRTSLENATFVKLTLGNYKGTDATLQKILVRLVTTKKGTRLYFLYRGPTRDTAKNYDFETGVTLIDEAFENGFNSAHLFTTQNDFQLELGKKGSRGFNTGKPTFAAAAPTEHNREKKTLISPDSFYLRALGITDDNGRVRDREQDKFRQVNKFVEVLASLIDKSELNGRPSLRIVDMGAGKGYLTFAAYDYLKNTRGIDVKITGVDTKPEMVEHGNGVAAAANFEGLKFELGSIADFDIGQADILIALHACNTATDDALFKGIQSKAELIIAAPCCHREIRPQIVPPEMFRDILKHGTMLERTAETITDGLRSLLLERSGYATKLFEFVPVEHTPKNNMLVGTRLKDQQPNARSEEQIRAVMDLYSIRDQRLLELLENNLK